MKKYIIEFLGTLLIVYITFATSNYLAIGAIVAITTLVGIHISGAAYNPALAIAYMYANYIPESDLIPYIVAEIAGALVAWEIYRYMK